MKINCIVVDDEHPALLKMQTFIERIPFLNLLKTFDNAIPVINYLKENQVDLIFLDIEMEGLTGLQLIKTLKYKPKIVLTTAYESYAIEAFSLEVADYLLKPISFERFLQAIDRVYEQLRCKAHDSDDTKIDKPYQDFMFVKTEYKIQRVDFDDVIYIQGLKEYLTIFTATGKYITLQSFKSIEEKLPSDRFIRVHRSYIVSIKKIESIEKNRIKIANEYIPIGEMYKEGFFIAINKFRL